MKRFFIIRVIRTATEGMILESCENEQVAESYRLRFAADEIELQV